MTTNLAYTKVSLSMLASSLLLAVCGELPVVFGRGDRMLVLAYDEELGYFLFDLKDIKNGTRSTFTSPDETAHQSILDALVWVFDYAP